MCSHAINTLLSASLYKHHIGSSSSFHNISHGWFHTRFSELQTLKFFHWFWSKHGTNKPVQPLWSLKLELSKLHAFLRWQLLLSSNTTTRLPRLFGRNFPRLCVSNQSEFYAQSCSVYSHIWKWFSWEEEEKSYGYIRKLFSCSFWKWD